MELDGSSYEWLFKASIYKLSMICFSVHMSRLFLKALVMLLFPVLVNVTDLNVRDYPLLVSFRLGELQLPYLISTVKLSPKPLRVVLVDFDGKSFVGIKPSIVPAISCPFSLGLDLLESKIHCCSKLWFLITKSLSN